MFKRYMKLALKGLWYVIRGVVNYIKIFVEMLIIIPGILLYASLYFEGKVVINMTTEAFITSPLFIEYILTFSFVFSALLFIFRWAESVSDMDLVLGKRCSETYLWALNEKKRFNADESVNFLRIMKKFGFFVHVNQNSQILENSLAQTVSYLKMALSLRGVDLSQFTEEDFTEIAKFLSPNCSEDTIGIDASKLDIMNDAFPLMEILRKEVESTKNEVLEENVYDTSLNKATTLLHNYLEDKKVSIPLIIVAEQDVIDALRKEYATILDTFALVDKVELFQKSRAFGMKPFEICTEDEFKMLDPRIIDCSKVIKYEKETV